MRSLIRSIACCVFLVLGAPGALAEDELTLEEMPHQNRFDFNTSALPQMNLASGFKVRGFQVGDNLYFGQARLAGRTTVGLVFEQGNTVYGLNHQGVQITRKF